MIEKMDLRSIPIENIEADMKQPRKDFKEIKDLIYSIIKHGLLEPLKVIELKKDKYKLIDGERRYRALSKIVSSAKDFDRNVKCFVLSNIKNKTILQLITDIHKQKLNPIEEADSFKELIKEDKFSIDEIKVMIGKPRDYIVKRLKLVAFNQFTQKKIREGKISPSVASSISISSIRVKEDAIISRIEEENANISRAKEIIYEEENRESSRIRNFSMGVNSSIKTMDDFISFFERIKDKDYKGVRSELFKIPIRELGEKVSQLKGLLEEVKL